MTANQPLRQRIYSLDLLRGLVMVLMALDHTRDFFHFDSFLHNPLDIATTTPWLYFTRWITHYCAPTFVFLSGVSIFLQALRKSGNELSVFLLKRGSWLLAVELIVVTFGWSFDAHFPVLVLGVIGAIGISMMFMAIIVRLPYAAALAIGLIITFGHNALDFLPSTHSGFFWDLARNGDFSFHQLTPHLAIAIVYPIIPWLGLMVLGYCAGKLFAPSFDPHLRKLRLLQLGTGLLVLFAIVRSVNIYGDPQPWTQQHDLTGSVLSFLDVDKYPPSLLYVCITIGPGLLFLAFAERTNNKLSRTVSVFGRVPFFYYMLHLYLIHLLCMISFLAHGHSFAEGARPVDGIPFNFLVPGEGYRLREVYMIWIAIVLSLYPLCAWFSKLKQRSDAWWLSYL
ncbi:MAG TPA: heparan-alpha-glucosaminide N-acetyltransferase domain-containing protein [Flavobacteriales bacterium]|nr:heparan-alpha-glucosaminide N-acetyltransferase domain-containing protein [Flavobacteriales bacterium]